MIPKDCKRLAEVDFPIAAVSKHAAQEKSIRRGHSSTLHLWWARRPLASCRAVLLGLLLPDPCDPHCPGEFKAQAAEALLDAPGWNRSTRQEQMQSDEGLRRALLEFIGDVANWDVANDPRWIAAARALVKAANGEEVPLVVDPFAGGGSIPLEALRLGCETFASDLNPAACLILKVMLEDIPRHGPELAEELRRVGGEIKRQAEKELSEFYPPRSRRRYPHCLSLGADRALRVAGVRRGHSAGTHHFGKEANHFIQRREPVVRVHVCEDEQAYAQCPVCQIFGVTPGERERRDWKSLKPARLIVRDVYLAQDDEATERLRQAKTDLPFTEVKWEAAIDRITAAAVPRQNERVPAGAIFAPFELVYSLYDLNGAGCGRDIEWLRYVFKAMELLEDDYLGGYGSRGAGKIRFRKITVVFKSRRYYEGEAEPETLAEGIDDVRQLPPADYTARLQSLIREG